MTGSQEPTRSDHRLLHPPGRLSSHLAHLLDSKHASQAAARPRAKWNPVTILPALLTQPPADVGCAHGTVGTVLLAAWEDIQVRLR